MNIDDNNVYIEGFRHGLRRAEPIYAAVKELKESGAQQATDIETSRIKAAWASLWCAVESFESECKR